MQSLPVIVVLKVLMDIPIHVQESVDIIRPSPNMKYQQGEETRERKNAPPTSDPLVTEHERYTHDTRMLPNLFTVCK